MVNTMIKKILAVCGILVLSFAAYSQRVISPVEGTYNNKQPLVIVQNEGEECFYSFTGSDPLTSGFAYDGPVLIDSTGDVQVNVVCISGDKREEYEVNFSVTDTTSKYTASASQNEMEFFVNNVVNCGVYTYSSDNPLSIPSELTYRIGDEESVPLAGTLFTIDSDNCLSRYIPCYVTDGNNKWRFVIKTSSEKNGVLARQEVPFKITDWSTFTFTGDKLIWSIDDSQWSSSKKPVKIDRTKKHTIRWQSVSYEAGNPVNYFELPVKPSVSSKYIKREGGAVEFSLNGDDRYRMNVSDSGASGNIRENNGIYDRIVFDVFAGDQISSAAEFDVYCDGVYQGKLSSSYKIDRQPPQVPVFNAGGAGSYARTTVTLHIEAGSDDEIFYVVSEPYLVSQEKLASDSFEYPQVTARNYRKYDKPLRLNAGRQGAVYYNVKAYAVDSSRNISEITEYNVVIDEYNYYIDGDSKSTMCDGSKAHPFVSFEQAANVINRTRFAHFYVKGKVRLPAGETVLSSNCSFSSIGNAEFIFPANASLLIRSAGFEADGVLFEKEKEYESSFTNVMFTLENSTANFNNCELVSIFNENGTAFVCRSSVINFEKSGLTVQGDVYGCGISGVDSKVNVRNSHFSTIAPTAVNFSLSGGSIELRGSDCYVYAHLGRIAELTKSTVRIGQNRFYGQFDKKIKNLTALWLDDDCTILENKENAVSGF